MAGPYVPAKTVQESGFGLALCKRLGIDPNIVSDDLRWEVTAGEELGKVSLTAFLPANEILAMWNGAAPTRLD